MVGAIPVMADVDRTSQTLTADSMRRVITPRTRAIIAVHLAGWPCDMDGILEVARHYGLRVIEDCAQAHGATYKGQPVGSMGAIAAFSFCQDKIITTGGEGGMLVTDDDDLWEAAWSFKDHGKDFAKATQKRASTQFHWVHDSFGTNWRMTEMQAAIGRVLLRKLDTQVETRRTNAATLSEQLAQVPGLRLTAPPAYVHHSYYKYYAFVRPHLLKNGWNRNRIIAAICAEGIPCSSGSCSEIYLENAFPFDMRPMGPLPVARELGETSLMFLVHPTLSEQDMLDTSRAVEKVLRTATASIQESLAA
jgi:dTDP-4-amino-4,6-dideoxygalactose transaminase